MCACEKRNINGTFGYKWQPSDPETARQVDRPTVPDTDAVLYDEPGRCMSVADRGDGVDSHCHHFVLVRGSYEYWLYVRHGGGDERVAIRKYFPVGALAGMTSDERYGTFLAIYLCQQGAVRDAVEAERNRWKIAIINKRTKVTRRGGRKYVEIMPAMPELAAGVSTA